MTPLELSDTVLRAVRHAVDAGELWVEIPARAPVTPPGPGGCGDYATPIALKLARPAGHPPLKVAEILRPHLAQEEGIRDVVVTPPGFLNITLRETSLVEEILARGPRYGYADTPGISGAPSTPLTHLHAPDEPRALVVLDTLARVLRSQATPVHTSCTTRPTPALTSTLGIEIDTYGPPPPNAVTIRPVPAPLPDTPPFFPLGRDATRWALLHPALHDHPHLTADHLAQRETNPLFRVRYAYARTRALTRNAAALGFTSKPPTKAPTLEPEPGVRASPTDGPADTHRPPTPTLTPSPTETHRAATATPRDTLALQDTSPPQDTPTPLHLLLADHPRILTTTATHHTPHRLTHHLLAIADALLPLLPAVLPTGEEKPEAAHRARLALAEAAGAVLAGGLSLLGIDAPEHL
ncbi:ArgS-related anticodon-binding protein NrtL [Streptomyces sp. ST1020]|uniref:ArgS-related anticodon-binding protein NrtL n=1 Tax=Streptomyces sp. ST1020 TaxID=1848901 RepID=UPI000DD6C86E|nr:DALR anticodon-binding domain-containing protein [Streptomyces sp. ST1020]